MSSFVRDFLDDEDDFAVIRMILAHNSFNNDDISSEEENNSGHVGGSATGRMPNKKRFRQEGARRLHADYFCDNPIYDAHDFRRRFRMRKQLFMRVHDAILLEEPYFIQRADACGLMGLHSLQKMTAALRMLTYASAADTLDDTMRMGEATVLESVKYFTAAVIKTFGGEYLREPTADDLQRKATSSSTMV